MKVGRDIYARNWRKRDNAKRARSGDENGSANIRSLLEDFPRVGGLVGARKLLIISRKETGSWLTRVGLSVLGSRKVFDCFVGCCRCLSKLLVRRFPNDDGRRRRLEETVKRTN